MRPRRSNGCPFQLKRKGRHESAGAQTLLLTKAHSGRRKPLCGQRPPSAALPHSLTSLPSRLPACLFATCQFFHLRFASSPSLASFPVHTAATLWIIRPASALVSLPPVSHHTVPSATYTHWKLTQSPGAPARTQLDSPRREVLGRQEIPLDTDRPHQPARGSCPPQIIVPRDPHQN